MRFQCPFERQFPRRCDQDRRAGHTPEECTRSCVRLGGKYVLVDSVHKKVYHLANPGLVEAFAAKKVRVKAMLGTNDVLSISSIEPR
ncbi:MAG: hypothetical protein DMG97_41175 [Acidobacteria bacterium]|nr:MAG: hypothetical protein DMG97_41175 [Acidobacteriota bacterium]